MEFCTIVLVLAPSTRHHLVLAPCTTFNSVPFFFGAGTKKVEHAPGSERSKWFMQINRSIAVNQSNHLCGTGQNDEEMGRESSQSRIGQETANVPTHLQYLIGDEGFACSSTLLTIVRSAEVGKITDPEFLTKVKAYNRALKKARVRIEHSFGCLKKRWPALLYKIRSSKIANIQAIISSAVVLHNFLLQDLDPISNIPDDEFERQIAEMRMDNINCLQRGQYRVRNHVLNIRTSF